MGMEEKVDQVDQGGNVVRIEETVELSIPRLLFYPFELAAGETSEWVSLRVSYKGSEWFQLLVRDPQGYVRMQALGKGQEMLLVVGQTLELCTLGSVPGSLSSGVWMVELAPYSKQRRLELVLEWQYGSGPAPRDEVLPLLEGEVWLTENGEDRFGWEDSLVSESRWYKGDFHMHTLLSDGKQTPRQLVETAVNLQRLDYAVITDHNLVHGVWPKKEGLLFMPGVEVTAFRGHFNVLGLRERLELYRGDGSSSLETEEGVERILLEARAQGALTSLNHPYLVPWDWRFNDVDLTLFDCVEIWNDPTYKGNAEAAEQALQLWDRLWERGLRLTGIGGSDTHMLPHESYEPGGQPSLVGDPATYVWCDGLRASTVLAAVQAGRCYVSRGLVLEPSIRCDGVEALPGAELGVAGLAEGEGIEIVYSIKVKEEALHPVDGRVIRWLENGRVVNECWVELAGSAAEAAYRTEWKGAGYRWLRAEVRGADGELLAFVNPVYVNPLSRPSRLLWEQVKEG